MATVNIRRDVDDKFYRYKMPVLQTKIEGRGNGIKTVIPNMDEIAKALSRPPTYPTKFFGCELGAQTTFANERYIVNGAHQPDRLRELLDAFIDKFVLCPSCKNPETVLLVDVKKEDIGRDCKACGAQTGIDMRHKLTAFILKNPPAGSTGKKGKKGDKGEKAVKKDKYADVEEMREQQLAGTNVPTIGTNGNGTGSPAGDEEDEIAKGFNNPAVANRSIGNDDWAVDTSAEAVAARIKNLAVNVDGFGGGLGEDDEDGEGGGDSKYDAFGAYIDEEKATATDAEIAAKAKELDVYQKHKACLELGQKLWEEDIVKDVQKRGKLLKVMTTSEKAQKALLGGIERYLGNDHPDLIPQLPKILMALYQLDVIEEEVVTSWGTHVSKKYVDKDVSKKVRKAAEPFLKWLEEAEESGEEDSDEE